MDPINRESKTSVYFNISYLMAMPWMMDKPRMVHFQQALLDKSLDFAQTTTRANGITLVRTDPSNLQVKFESPGPQVSALHIICNNPQYDLDMFIRDADAVTEAVKKTLAMPQYQVIQSSAKIQHLYSCEDHAFKYLWETRLGQSPEDFKTLGKRPVAGGGLRFVMPPHAAPGEEPHSIEVRIQSALREPRKLVIETIFVWPQPHTIKAEENFNPTNQLNTVEQYAANEVFNFLIGG